MPSEAEARVRAKAEALLRERFPLARIVHELQLEQGGVRIDLAAITPDYLVCVEVKSELDVLKRLERQVRTACRRADEVWIVAAGKHADKIKALWQFPYEKDFDADELAGRRSFYDVTHRARLLVEAPLTPRLTDHRPMRNWQPNLINPADRFDLLWAGEMRDAIGLHFGGATIPGADARMNRYFMTRQAVDHMTGREIRRAVCAQLRARSFPRADPACPIAREFQLAAPQLDL